MKVFRNGKMYVEMVDILYLDILPRDILTELKEVYDYQENVVAFENEESINYFKQREDIIDYDYISNLSSKELDELIVKIYLEIDSYAREWLAASLQRRRVLDKKEKAKREKKLKYQYETLVKYNKEKEMYDGMFRKLGIEEKKTLKK